jgi:GNAT superfamily N-acetyltransferase
MMTYSTGADRQHECEIRREDISSSVANALIQSLNAELSDRYPEEGANHFRLDPEEVAEGRGVFYVAYRDAQPIGCGAVRLLNADTAEIKRMYVAPGVRGNRIGRVLLDSLESEARRLGARLLVLETGERQPEAVALYARAGFVRIAAFGEYIGSPLSVCMAKSLQQPKPE